MKYSVWLTLSETDEEFLSGIINNLAREYSAPAFRPHCTIFSPWDEDPDVLMRAFRANEFPVFSVEMEQINYSDWIWKTVFIELKRNQTLERIYQRITQLTWVQYDFQPHISLIYKTLSSAQREKIIKQLHPKPLYQFTALEIVETGGDVVEWNSRIRIPLGS